MMSGLKPYTLPSRSKPAHEPKLVKEYVLANAKNEMNKIKTAYNNVYEIIAPFGMLRHHTRDVVCNLNPRQIK